MINKILRVFSIVASVTVAVSIMYHGEITPVAANNSSSSVYDGISSPGPIMNPSPVPCIGGEEVLLIQDNVSWFAPIDQDPLGANVTELKAQNKDFCIINSTDISSTDLRQFPEIIISAAQVQAFYDNLFPGGTIHSDIISYVQGGGILSANLTDCASGPGAGGTWATEFCNATEVTSHIFIGGVKHVNDFPQDNNIATSNHPIITGQFGGTNGGQIVDIESFQDLNDWNFSSHGFFTNLPLNNKTILVDNLNRPVMIEYPFGNGVVIASQVTNEWRYAGNFGGLPQNKKLLANEIGYQNSLAGLITLNVPLYTQRVSDFPSQIQTQSWANAIYAEGRGNLGPEDDRCGLTIAQCGCVITSAVMIARFYGVTEAQDQNVQPLNLNNWLNTHNGYDAFGGFKWSALNRYTNYRVEFVKADTTQDNFSLLEQHLLNSEPLIAKANADRGGSLNIATNHFFVIDGKRLDGSYRVKDPFWFNTDSLTETATDRNLALRNYEGGFDGLRIYKKGDGIAKSSLNITVGSPAELLLTDLLGRRAGKDPITGITYSEIPDSSYFADAIGDATGEQSPTGHVSKTIYIFEPADGNYNLQVIGTDEGLYTLEVTAVNNQGEVHETQTTGVTDTNISSSFETSFLATATEALPLIKEVSFESIQRDIEIALHLGIIDNRGIAKSLFKKLRVAELNAQKGKLRTAQNILTALKREVKAQKEKHINEPFATALLQDIDALSHSL